MAEILKCGCQVKMCMIDGRLRYKYESMCARHDGNHSFAATNERLDELQAVATLIEKDN